MVLFEFVFVFASTRKSNWSQCTRAESKLSKCWFSYRVSVNCLLSNLFYLVRPYKIVWHYRKPRTFSAGGKSDQFISCACFKVCNKMADGESKKWKQNDHKALYEFFPTDNYQVNYKERYRSKSKIFQVERLLSKRKSGNGSTYSTVPLLIYFLIRERVPYQVERMAHVIMYLGPCTPSV